MRLKHWLLWGCLLLIFPVVLWIKVAKEQCVDNDFARFVNQASQEPAEPPKCDKKFIKERLAELSDADPVYRETGAWDFGLYCEQLIVNRQEVLTALRRQLSDGSPPARHAAAVTLAKLDFENSKDQIKPALLESIQRDSVFQHDAADIFERYGDYARDLAPALAKVADPWGIGFRLSENTALRVLRSIDTPEARAKVESLELRGRFYIFVMPQLISGTVILFSALFVLSLWLKRKLKGLLCWTLIPPGVIYGYSLIGGYLSSLYRGGTPWGWVRILFNIINSNFPLLLIIVSVALVPWMFSLVSEWSRYRKAEGGVQE